jgi:hypothetical protein
MYSMSGVPGILATNKRRDNDGEESSSDKGGEDV